MGKRVIVCAGHSGYFRDLSEASEALGVSPGTVSRWISEGGKCRYVPRVYALLLRDGEWMVGCMNARGSAYIGLGAAGAHIRSASVVKVKDLTSVWYD